ncbi:Increased rDNA silencing protein [Sporothrix bragantina]|uniref:Increased rDNA silencing protein n=1 Tax=Sporothrix bragantina TaxID=671064 RepID=A0ABP0BBS7_9PEZI
MSGPGGSSAASDNAAATAAALRGAALAFGRQKKAEQQQTQLQQAQKPQLPSQQHVQHLPPPNRPRRLPSISPSRDSAVSTNLSNNHTSNALLAAASAAASSSRDASVGSTGIRSGRAGANLLRPVSPGKLSTTSGSGTRSRSQSTSNSNGDSSQSRSRSRGRNTREGTADIGSSPSSTIFVSPRPAIERMPTGGSRAVLASTNARSSSFLAATLAASQAASPRVTPSHTGSGSIAGGVVPTHLSAALLASAASDERQRAAKAATAASLAAAAATSTENMIRRGIYIDGRAPVFDEDEDDPDNHPDTSAIPATSSLVSIFEKEQNSKKSATTAGKSPARPPRQKAFTPPRSLSPEQKAEVLAKTAAKAPAKTPTKTAAKPLTKPATKTPTIAVSPSPSTPPGETPKPKLQPKPQLKPPPQPRAEPKIEAPEPQKTKPIPIPKPKPQPQPTAAPDIVSSSPLEKIDKLERASTGSSSLKAHRIPLRDLNAEADVMDRPAPPRPRIRDSSATSSRSLPKEGDLTSAGPSRAASSPSRGPPPVAPPRRSATALVARHTGDSPSPHRRPSAASTTAAMTATSVDGLASAIMAGSLAAARHPTSSSSSMMVRSPSSSLPSSRSRTPPASAHSARSTSPVKRTGMLQTLRRDRVHSDDDDYDRDGTSSGNTQYRRSHYHRDGRLRQGKHHLSHATPAALVGGGRHRHKHHEGARRRWREAVSDRQRRRYEAVWASNRGSRGIKGGGDNDDGASVVANDDEETVPNVVVRDLWRRSRLPVDELAEVWDLVDETGTGRLTKAGFVVGLWLIDQRLRGRKIPARVSESVWTSARGVQAPKPRKR